MIVRLHHHVMAKQTPISLNVQLFEWKCWMFELQRIYSENTYSSNVKKYFPNWVTFLRQYWVKDTWQGNFILVIVSTRSHSLPNCQLSVFCSNTQPSFSNKLLWVVKHSEPRVVFYWIVPSKLVSHAFHCLHWYFKYFRVCRNKLLKWRLAKTSM